MSHGNFNFVGLARDASSLTILVSMLISKYKPDLNVQIRSYLVLTSCHFRFNCAICNHFITLISYIFRYFFTEDEHSEAPKL